MPVRLLGLPPFVPSLKSASEKAVLFERTAFVAPAAWVKAPLTLSVPIAPSAGERVEPDWSVVAPTTPVPASAAPLRTVVAEAPSEPFTTRVPAVTVVGPVRWPVPA